MRVTMDRNVCGSWPPACEECFNMLLMRNDTDRACIRDVVEDGSETVTVVIKSGHFVGTLVVPPEDREAVMREGWIKFSTLPPEAFDIQQPRAADLRGEKKD